MLSINNLIQKERFAHFSASIGSFESHLDFAPRMYKCKRWNWFIGKYQKCIKISRLSKNN